MTREKLRLVPGVPMLVTLEDAIGREMPSRFSESVDYCHAVQCRGAACLLYLPVEGEQALRRIDARSGDDIEIVKVHVNGSAPSFKVYRVSDAREPVVPTRKPAATETEAPVEGIRMLAPRTQVAPKAQQVAKVAPVASATPTVVHPLQEIMQRCMIVAGTALWRGYEELVAAGCAYDAPTIEDVRAAGISMFIERTRNMNGGR